MLEDIRLKVVDETSAVMAEVLDKFCCELWSCEVDFELNRVCLVVGVDKLSHSNQNLIWLKLLDVDEGHPGLLVHSVGILSNHLGYCLRTIVKLIEDFDLVVNADSRILSKALDAVSDLSAETHLLELFSLFGV